MLADIIHLIAAREHASEDDKPYYPRPSIAGPERCLRQTVYWAQGEKKKPLPGRAIAVFNDGVWHEELTADWLRKSSYLVHSEQMPVSIAGILHWMPQGSWHCAVCDHDIPYRDIHGHIDFMIQDTPGVDRLVEHKGYAHFTAEALWGGQIPHDNLTQKAIYLRGTQQDQPDCKEGILLIKNKNTSGFLEFRSLYEAKIDTLTVIERVNHLGEREDIGLVVPDITENAFARFAEIERHRIEGTLPERQYDIDSWRCGYCPFTTICWAGWAEEHQQLTQDVALDEEISTAIRYERQKAAEESETKKEREDLKKQIKALLSQQGVRSGRTNEYTIDWEIEMKPKFDKELLPPGMYRACSPLVPAERLKIKNIKEKEGHGQKVHKNQGRR